jgi:hypothetical protein
MTSFDQILKKPINQIIVTKPNLNEFNPNEFSFISFFNGLL